MKQPGTLFCGRASKGSDSPDIHGLTLAFVIHGGFLHEPIRSGIPTVRGFEIRPSAPRHQSLPPRPVLRISNPRSGVNATSLLASQRKIPPKLVFSGINHTLELELLVACAPSCQHSHHEQQT
jgi:hypothetical protein